MSNSGLQRMMNLGFSKLKPNPNESESLSDFRFAKKCQNLTTFGFGFKLHHIPIFHMCKPSKSTLLYYKIYYIM